MTRDVMTRRRLFQHRLLDSAAIERAGTARVKPAARRRLDRVCATKRYDCLPAACNRFVASFVHSATVMTSNPPRSVLERLAVAALLLAALSFGCGKPERGPDKPAKASPGVAVDRSVGLPDEFPKDVPILKNATLNATILQGDRMIVQLHTTAS